MIIITVTRLGGSGEIRLRAQLGELLLRVKLRLVPRVRDFQRDLFIIYIVGDMFQRERLGLGNGFCWRKRRYGRRRKILLCQSPGKVLVTFPVPQLALPVPAILPGVLALDRQQALSVVLVQPFQVRVASLLYLVRVRRADLVEEYRRQVAGAVRVRRQRGRPVFRVNPFADTV